jgi:serpin B
LKPFAASTVKTDSMKSLRLGAFVLPLLFGCPERRLPDPRAVAEPAAEAPPSTVTLSAAVPAVEGTEIALDREAGAPGTKERRADADGANRFTLSLFEKLGSGNLVASGTSARFACGMAALGAGGETASEMANAFAIDPDPVRAAELARAERTDWATITDSELSIANRLWVASSFPIRPGYSAAVADAYDAPAESLDFGGSPSASRRTINAWVSGRTRGRIPELLREGTPSAESLAILTNAVYFKGVWTRKFAKDNTRSLPFRPSAMTSVGVPFMHATEEVRYAEAPGVQVLEKTYGKEGRMAMSIVLPTAVDGLPALEKKLTEQTLRVWTSSLAPKTVEIQLPKFKIESTLPMKAALQTLGMRSAFEQGAADFSRIAPRGLVIADVVQKAMIEVDEEGTVAAAATYVEMGDPWASSGPPIFRADHPFLFFLRDTRTGRILFMGRVVDPR